MLVDPVRRQDNTYAVYFGHSLVLLKEALQSQEQLCETVSLSGVHTVHLQYSDDC